MPTLLFKYIIIGNTGEGLLQNRLYLPSLSVAALLCLQLCISIPFRVLSSLPVSFSGWTNWSMNTEPNRCLFKYQYFRRCILFIGGKKAEKLEKRLKSALCSKNQTRHDISVLVHTHII